MKNYINIYAERRQKNKPMRSWSISLMGQSLKFNEFDIVLVKRLRDRIKTTAKDKRASQDVKNIVIPLLTQFNFILKEMDVKFKEGRA